MNGRTWSTYGRLLAAALALTIAALVVAACASGEAQPVPGDPSPGKAQPGATVDAAVTPAPTPAATSAVNVDLQEWSVLPEQPDVAAGDVTLVVLNTGSELHELVAVRTDLGAHDLPRDKNGGADEHKVEVVGRTEPLVPGEGANLVLGLNPGKYVFICNIVEVESSGETEAHYQQGMSTAFVVH